MQIKLYTVFQTKEYCLTLMREANGRFKTARKSSNAKKPHDKKIVYAHPHMLIL